MEDVIISIPSVFYKVETTMEDIRVYAPKEELHGDPAVAMMGLTANIVKKHTKEGYILSSVEDFGKVSDGESESYKARLNFVRFVLKDK